MKLETRLDGIGNNNTVDGVFIFL